MKIAVIGAGIFGTTIALKLSKTNSDVTLYDTKNDILTSASKTNQLRLHRGYHYPRSNETVTGLLESVTSFVEQYRSSIVTDNDHYYCIANDLSLTSPADYLKFCDDNHLEYEHIDRLDIVKPDKVSLIIKAQESLLDYHALYADIRSMLAKSNIKLRLGTQFNHSDIQNFDVVVNCTYANINHIIDDDNKKQYQFEVCEKIVVNPPGSLHKKSIVIMDGPFMCIDPYGKTGYSLWGNVQHAIHSTNVGTHPVIPAYIAPYLNKGIVINRSISNYDLFREAGAEFIPAFNECVYVGSMYTARTVLPNVEETDSRPTIVTRLNDKIINVFSGKIDTCVTTAQQVVDLIQM